MKVTILGSGTSQGIPIIMCNCEVCRSNDPKDKRLRTSILIETEDTTICIDAGPDFRYQMLRANVQKLDAILITHEHKDHIGGLDDVRPFIFKQQKPITGDANNFTIHGVKMIPKLTKHVVKKVIRVKVAFKNS